MQGGTEEYRGVNGERYMGEQRHAQAGLRNAQGRRRNAQWWTEKHKRRGGGGEMNNLMRGHTNAYTHNMLILEVVPT